MHLYNMSRDYERAPACFLGRAPVTLKMSAFSPVAKLGTAAFQPAFVQAQGCLSIPI